MSKRLMIASGLFVAFIAMMTWVTVRQPREPMYEGKPLRFWLQRYSTANRSETSVQEADHALDAIGTNAVPTLLRLIQAQDSPAKVKLLGLLAKQHYVKIEWIPEEESRFLAVHGFLRLRSDGRVAVPELIKIYERNGPDSSIRVIQRRGAVIDSLRVIGPAAKDAVPMLIDLPLKDANVFFRANAIVALGEIHSSPELAVPALVRCLDDPDQSVRPAVARALEQFGADAKLAVPRLKTLLKGKDFPLQIASMNALSRIDPAAADEINNADGKQGSAIAR